MPPWSLPLAHFMVALCWLVAGSAGLVIAAPLLARGQWLLPATAAVTHAFTLGWVLTSAYGALYQLAPVAFGMRSRSVPVAVATLVLHLAGTLCIVLGLAWLLPGVTGLGWMAVALGLALWTWNLGVRLLNTPRATRAGRIAAAGFAFLWIALGVAGARVGQGLGWWMAPRQAVVAAHVQLALGGFATLLAMGVGSHILPMFMLTRNVRDTALRVAAPLVGTGVTLQAVGWLGTSGALVTVGTLSAAAGIGAFAVQAWQWFRGRGRAALDTPLVQAVSAVIMLVLATVAGLVALATGAPNAIAAYGVAAVVGWLGLLVGAVYGRVIPFLTWLNRFRNRAGKPGVPKIGDVLPRRTLMLTTGMWIAGALLLTGSVAAGLPAVARGAALLYTAGSIVALSMYIRLLLPEPASLPDDRSAAS